MKHNRYSLRDMLSELPTPQLETMLQAELQKDTIDENAIRLSLEILKERDADCPVETNAEIERAWDKYLAESKEPARKPRWVLRVASVAAVLCLILLVVPGTANAESFYDLLVRWTDSVMEFLIPSSRKPNKTVYEFKTDNVGLQEVYEAVVELGITDPVVPMWLPEGFELVSCRLDDTSRAKRVVAVFSNNYNQFVFQVDVYNSGTSRTYHKDDGAAITREINGITHTILQNDGRWTVVWSAENVECFVIVECQEEILHEIIESIYGMEDD